MIREEDLQNCLGSLIGWRETQDPCRADDLKLSSELTTSRSGLFYNDIHPLLQLDNLYQVAPNFSQYIDNTSDWDSLTAYNTGDRAKVGSTVYESLVDGNLNLDPTANPAEWEEVLYFSNWLKDFTDQAVNKWVHDVIAKKNLRGDTKALLDNLKVYDSAGRLQDKVNKTGRFVGIQIVLDKYEYLNGFIPQLGLQFDSQQTNLPIYLYHSSQLEPVAVYSYTSTKVQSVDWVDISSADFRLHYFDKDTDVGGAYYLGYYEDDINGQAIQKNYDYSKQPCSSCNRFNYKSWTRWTRYMTLTPMNVANNDLNGTQLWDVGKIRYTNFTNYGVNFAISNYCDLTDFFCGQSDRFVDIQGKQVAVDALKHMLFSIRENGLSDKTKSMAMSALNGGDGIQGVAEELQQAIDALDFTFSDLNTPCLPCATKAGVKWRSI